MKRRYKEGDWIRVPLDANVDAIGIIARACRSRLFGYFFAAPAGRPPSHAQLKCLRTEQAAACALFGGAPLEDARWRVIATSVPFDRQAWPFPQFSARGAFGRTWTKDTYDADTMQVVRRETIDQAAAQGLPDSRFASAWELEALLRERFCGIPPGAPFAVYEVHAGFDPNALDILARGGRVQFSEQISADDLQHIAQFIERYPDVEIRVHGFSTRPFDLRSLAAFQTLRALTIQTGSVEGTDALEALRQLRRLRVGPLDRPAALHALPSLPDLREIEVRGRHADLRAVAACSHLTALALIDVPAIDLGALACREVLAELTIAHCAAHLEQIAGMTALAKLCLRDMRLDALPDLSRNAALRAVILRRVTRVRDLAPLARAPLLSELEIAGMPQLDVSDFRALSARPPARLRVDIGSRTKSREVYRLLHVGTIRP